MLLLDTFRRVGVDGLTREEMSKMNVYFKRCIHKMSEMEAQIKVYKQRVDELEGTVRLSTLVEVNLSTLLNPLQPETE